MKNKSAIIVIAILIIIIVVFWKIVYKNGYAKKESGYYSIDGSWYMVPQWQDSWSDIN